MKEKEGMMDYFRFGTCAGWDAPGGNVLLGLMGKLSMLDGAMPGQLVLAEASMNGGLATPPAVSACELLVHVIDGAVRACVGEEEVNLIADNSLWIHEGDAFSFSTERSVGMTALLVIPSQEGHAHPAAGNGLLACCGEALSLKGDPRSLPIGALDILASLNRLTGDGCTVPMVALARGGFNRDVIFASLLTKYASDPLALRAFVWAFNAHPSAHWWMDRACAKTALEEGITKLLAR
jgi:hypothetical protein